MKKLAFIFVCFFFATFTISSVAQTLTTLVSFNGTNGGDPVAPLIQDTDGNFYGTTYCGGGGQGGCGTIFKMAPSGTLTTLHQFCSQSSCADGELPTAPLVKASDGNFYGTTYAGGYYGGDSCQAV